MILRADHVAGAFFVAVGLLVIALSGDLPIGETSMPGAGFMPLLVAALLIVFGSALVLRAKENRPFSEIDWGDGGHAAAVLAIVAAAAALYVRLGFIITMFLMIVTLLVAIERRNVFRAGLYAAVVVTAGYLVFANVLQRPLPGGLLGY